MSLKNYIFTSINTKSLEAEDFANNFTIRVKKQRNTRKLSQIAEVDRRASQSAPTATSSSPPPPSSSGHDANNFDRLRRTISSTDDISWFKKIMKLWSYISVEPVMVCWILPSCLLYIAIENLALEKVSVCTLSAAADSFSSVSVNVHFVIHYLSVCSLRTSVMPSEFWLQPWDMRQYDWQIAHEYQLCVGARKTTKPWWTASGSRINQFHQVYNKWDGYALREWYTSLFRCYPIRTWCVPRRNWQSNIGYKTECVDGVFW